MLGLQTVAPEARRRKWPMLWQGHFEEQNFSEALGGLGLQEPAACSSKRSNPVEQKPAHLFNAWIKPLVPTCFTLLGRLPNQERRYPCPLVLAIFHNRSLEDFILGVLPNTALDHNPHGA